MDQSQSPDAWAEAAATKTLDLNEMDTLVTAALVQWSAYEEAKKIATAQLDAYNRIESKILTALKDAGKKSYKVDGLATVSLSQKAIVRVPGTIEAKRNFFAYLRSLGEDIALSLMTVNSNSLNSWYSLKLEEYAKEGRLGFSAPGLEDPTMRETLSVRTDKKGKI